MSRSIGIVGGLAAACLVAPLPIPAAVQAGDKGPAVSRINGKMSVEGGDFDADGIGLARGTVAIPLGHSWGFQADGDIGELDGETIGGGAAHVFTRDPGRYLFGIYGSFHEWESIEVGRVAGEFELYRGKWTFGGLIGWESVDVPTTVNGLAVTNTDDEHVFTELDLSWYPKENLRISGGYHYENEESLASGSFEYMPGWENAPASFYANYDFGDDGYTRVVGGVRFYMNGGENKTLIRRQREDDPPTYLPIFPNIMTASPTQTGGGNNFCPVTEVFRGADFPGCTCPPGTPLAGQDPFIVDKEGSPSTCLFFGEG